MGWRNVQACALGKPTNGINNALVLALLFKECGGFLVFIQLGTGIDGCVCVDLGTG